jgi:UDP-3-O-[3-hydroxymyristoyl] glucosamine N-acyltransferase
VGSTLAELAVRFGCVLQGDPAVRVERVATLQAAGPESLTFLANAKYARHLSGTRAGAVVLDPRLADRCPVPALLSANPYATYARIAAELHPPPAAAAGRHPQSVVDPAAHVDPSASIGPNAVIEAGAHVGPRAHIGPGCVVMRNAQVGADTKLAANVTLCAAVVVGQRCLLHPGVVIGADGFGLAPDAGKWVKVPQVGSVRIGDDVEIGANTTIDRGAIDDTMLEEGVKLDNQIQVGHNVRIGAHTAIAGCTGISGSTTIGKRCLIAGQVGIAGHLEICDDVVVTGKTLVSSSIDRPGMYSGSLSADDASTFRRNAARFRRLDDLAGRVRRLEQGAHGDGDDPRPDPAGGQ